MMHSHIKGCCCSNWSSGWDAICSHYCTAVYKTSTDVDCHVVSHR